MRGVGETSIWEVGFGKAVPLRPNDSEANMAMNRRVEFLLATQPTALALWVGSMSGKLCEGEGCDVTGSMGRKFTATPTTLQPSRTDVTTPAARPIEIEMKADIIQVGRPSR